MNLEILSQCDALWELCWNIHDGSEMGNQSTKNKDKPRSTGKGRGTKSTKSGKPDDVKQRVISEDGAGAADKSMMASSPTTQKRVSCSGSVAVIIGAAQGIGRACVEALLQKNVKVCFGDVDEALARKTLAELQQKYGADNVIFVKCDISNTAEVKAVFAAAITRWHRVDIFSPMAGIMNEKTWRKSIEINLVGTIDSTQIAMEHMGKDKGGAGGAIVLMSSFAGHQAFFCSPVYSATKHAVLGYLKSFADKPQYDSHGVRLYALCPGPTATNFIMDERVRYRVMLPLVMRQYMGQFEVIQPAAVAEAFLRCVEDPSLHGSALGIGCENGKTLVQKLDLTARTIDLPPLVD